MIKVKEKFRCPYCDFKFNRGRMGYAKHLKARHPEIYFAQKTATNGMITANSVQLIASDQDMVNLPPHYRQGKIECIDAIKAALTNEEWRGFLKGQVLKYTWRERWKGGVEDVGKAGFYLERLKELAQPTKGRAISKAEAEEGEDKQ